MKIQKIQLQKAGFNVTYLVLVVAISCAVILFIASMIRYTVQIREQRQQIREQQQRILYAGTPITEIEMFDLSIKTVIGVIQKDPALIGTGQWLFVTKSPEGMFKIWDIKEINGQSISVGDIIALQRETTRTNIVVIGRDNSYPSKSKLRAEKE